MSEFSTFLDTTTCSGTLREFWELQHTAGYLLYFENDFKIKTTNIVGIFGNNFTNQKIVLVGYKFFNDEIKPQLYGNANVKNTTEEQVGNRTSKRRKQEGKK